MLLDADAAAYGSLIPEVGALNGGGDASAEVYAAFEYKIPENADGSLNTQNIVFNNSVTLRIPAGTYDWCITNPTPGDRMWIASENGNVSGRQNDYVFESGQSYEFTVSLGDNVDRVDLTTGGAVTVLHEHTWSYTADGAAITAHCTDDCTITEGLTLTLSAPTGELTEDGTATFPATPITADVTLHAKWTPNDYTLVSVEGVTADAHVWTKNSGAEVVITAKLATAPDTSYAHFTGVEIDNVPLVRDTDFTDREGSTVVTLKPTTLQELSLGGHTVTLLFDNGRVNTNLTVQAPPAPGSSTSSPATGDESSAALWFALLLFSGAGLAATFSAGKRRARR